MAPVASIKVILLRAPLAVVAVVAVLVPQTWATALILQLLVVIMAAGVVGRILRVFVVLFTGGWGVTEAKAPFVLSGRVTRDHSHQLTLARLEVV